MTNPDDAPSRMIQIRWYLGDKCAQETWLNGDSESDMQWLWHYKRDAANSFHPAVRMTVDAYIHESGEVVVPSNPVSLEEAAGS